MLPLRQMIFGKASPAPQKPLDPISVNLDGRDVLVKLKRHAAARRMVLRLARDGESFTLTLPKRQGISAAKTFVEASSTWMQNTLAHRGRKSEPSQGQTLHLRGHPVQLVRSGKLRGLVQHDPGQSVLHLPGTDQHWERRLTEWLKHEAEQDLRKSSQHYAELMQTRFTRLTVRDQKSRWGSCSSDGALSYSWRLILAPPFVLDYVAAHEVAHLKEMNHGPRFWRLVLAHCPRTREAKQWLKSNGHTLHHGL